MTTNGVSNSDPNLHVYKGNRDILAKPSWAHKHDGRPRSRNLLPYLLDPSAHPDRVLRVSKDSVVIADLFPKAQVHLLVLPKWQPHRDLHPHDAFEDPDFLAMMKVEVKEGLGLATSLLQSKVQEALLDSGMSVQHIEALLGKRDFSKDFQIGIHAHPSQHELHVHIISRDMVSTHDYHARHYQAFNTPFFVQFKLYPLPPDDIRREVDYQNANLMKDNLACWRCGKDCGTNWTRMRAHLLEEWGAWIREGSEGV